MDEPDGARRNVAILIADIADSTVTRERLGRRGRSSSSTRSCG